MDPRYKDENAGNDAQHRAPRGHTNTMATRRPPQPRNWPLVAGLVGFTGFMCAVPLLLQQRHRRLSQGVSLQASERSLSPNEARRGVYLNTGSKDVGADPDWALKDGVYQYKGRATSIIDETTGLAPQGSASMRASR